MGKNVTIYLPDEVAQKMDKLPEVNWSEICRKAITEYVETRTQTDLTSVITRLKNESKTDYTKGKLVIYEDVAPKLSIQDLERTAEVIDIAVIIAGSYEPALVGDSKKLSPEEAQAMTIGNMRHSLRKFRRNLGAKVPDDFSDSYVEGAIAATKEIYKQVKSRSL